MQLPSMLMVAPSGMENAQMLCGTPSCLRLIRILMGIAATLDPFRKMPFIAGTYFFINGRGFRPATITRIRPYSIHSAAIPAINAGISSAIAESTSARALNNAFAVEQ